MTLGRWRGEEKWGVDAGVCQGRLTGPSRLGPSALMLQQLRLSCCPRGLLSSMQLLQERLQYPPFWVRLGPLNTCREAPFPGPCTGTHTNTHVPLNIRACIHVYMHICVCVWAQECILHPLASPKGVQPNFLQKDSDRCAGSEVSGLLGRHLSVQVGPILTAPCPSGLQNLGSLPDQLGSPACSGQPQFTQLCIEPHWGCFSPGSGGLTPMLPKSWPVFPASLWFSDKEGHVSA